MTAPTYKPPTRMLGHVSDAYYEAILEDVLADLPAELQWPLSINTYASVQRDPTAWATLQGYVLQLLRAQWQLDGRGCDPDLTAMVADDLGLPVVGKDEQGAARMRGVSWGEHLRAALSNHLTFGHFGSELGAEIVDGKARLVTLAERPPSTITQIHVDPKTGAFLGITQDAIRRDGKPQIPSRQMAWYCNQRQGAAWQGVSIYRQIAPLVAIKREMIRVHATSNRRWGMGVPVMEALPGTAPTPEQMVQAQQLAGAARGGEQAGAATPPGFQLKLTGISGSLPPTQEFLAWIDRQILRAVLMPHLDLGQGTTGGARSLGEAFIDSWTLSLESIGQHVCDVATRQIAARIVEWNRGTNEAVPQVVVSGIGSRREVTAESLARLLDAGALAADPALEAWVRREYRLPERVEMEAPTGRAYEFDIANGVVTVNERRAQIGLPPVDGGDVLRDPNAAPIPTPESTTATPKAEPVTAKRRRRQADGQLALPIAAATEQDDDRIQTQYEAALTALLAAWPTLAAPLVDDLAGQAAAGSLTTLAASAATLAPIETALAEALTAASAQSAIDLGTQAIAAGATDEVPTPDETQAATLATVTASLIASAYAAAATRRALLAPAGSVADAVRTALDDMSTSGKGVVADHLGAALSMAQGHGRLAVMAAVPAVEYVGIEDAEPATNRCPACTAAADKRYSTLAAALEDRPNAMQLATCAGSARCRGRLEPVWV